MKQIILRFAGAGLVALATVGPVAAQENPTGPFNRLAEELSLTEAQRNHLQETMTAEPGSAGLWKAAAALQSSLTADQKSELMARAATSRAFAQGVRAGRSSAAGQGQVTRTGRGRTLQGRVPTERGVRGAPGTQGRGTQVGQRARRAPVVDRVLDLSDEQREAMESARKEYRETVRGLAEERRDGELDRDAYRERTASLRTEMRERMEAVLTDEQKERMEEARVRGEGRRNARGVQRPGGLRAGADGSRPGGRAGAPAARRGNPRNLDGMTEALGLSDVQRETIEIHGALTALVGGRMAARAVRPAAGVRRGAPQGRGR